MREKSMIRKVKFVIEVTREEGGDFQAKFVEGPPQTDAGHFDLTYWGDVPCTTPGEALKRIGEQLDAELLAFACDSMGGDHG